MLKFKTFFWRRIGEESRTEAYDGNIDVRMNSWLADNPDIKVIDFKLINSGDDRKHTQILYDDAPDDVQKLENLLDGKNKA